MAPLARSVIVVCPGRCPGLRAFQLISRKMSTPLMPSLQSADAYTPSPKCKRLRHDIRDSKGKLTSKQEMSPEFLCKYIEWRKSRLALLPSTRKRDSGWYASLPWSQWLSDGIVENDNVPSMRTLARIYDNVKVESPGILALQRAHRQKSM